MKEANSVYIQGSGRRRKVAATAARIGILGLFALSLPLDGSRTRDVASNVTPEVPGLTPLPAGWPGEAPAAEGEWELRVWNSVYRQCVRFGIAGEALAMYTVLWEESRLEPEVVSPGGLYVGISQFAKSTFRRNVRSMKRLGVVAEEAAYSPFDPDQAIEVMAWMWSQGYSSHWGPYRKVARKLEKEAVTARLVN